MFQKLSNLTNSKVKAIIFGEKPYYPTMYYQSARADERGEIVRHIQCFLSTYNVPTLPLQIIMICLHICLSVTDICQTDSPPLVSPRSLLEIYCKLVQFRLWREHHSFIPGLYKQPVFIILSPTQNNHFRFGTVIFKVQKISATMKT